MKRMIIKLLFPVLVCSLFITMRAANAQDGDFKLLTLNLLFSEPTTSPSSDGGPRFDAIANFILNEDIDCVLSQEVVGGKLPKEVGLTETINSSLDLKRRLNRQYNLVYRLANGIPLVFSVGNAIFCKKSIDIKWTVSKSLPFAYEITIHGIDIRLRRVIMGSLLDAPGYGKLLLFNVHFCSGCPTEQRQAQIEVALEFIRTVKNWASWIYGDVPAVFGGDFNIRDQYPPAYSVADEYDLITGAGFVDAYSDFTGCRFEDTCCVPETDPLVIEEGCTYAVADNLFQNDPSQTTRIDYFFLQGLTASSAYVVFNGDEGPFVSDHSGLVVEIPSRPDMEERTVWNWGGR